MSAEVASDSADKPVDTSEDGRRVLSRQRFLEGVAAYEAGRFKDAIDLMLEADSAMHSAAFAFNIGLAYQAMGDASSALRWMRTYLREVPNAEDRPSVEAMIGSLEQRLQSRGVQQVTVLSKPEGAMVLIDGRAVGVTPWTGDLAPGRHIVNLQLRGYADAESAVDLEAHRARDVSIVLVPGPAKPVGAVHPAVAGEESPDSGGGDTGADSRGFGPWPWIALGAGAGALGGALAFELMRASAVERAEGAAQVDYLDDLDTARQHQLTARILAGVGGALAATGAVLLVIDLGSKESPVSAGLGCTPVGCSVTARGKL